MDQPLSGIPGAGANKIVTGSPQNAAYMYICMLLLRSHDLWILAAMTAHAMDIVQMIKQTLIGIVDVRS